MPFRLPKKAPKYRNRKTTVDGLDFDSQGEANHWFKLKLRERAGEITGLKRQVRYDLHGVDGRKVCAIVPDYEYTIAATGELVTADFKGTVQPMFLLKAKLFAAEYGRQIVVVKK